MTAASPLIVAVNAGSSSLKLGVYRGSSATDATGDIRTGSPVRVVGIDVERIGTAHASMRVRAAGGTAREQPVPHCAFDEAFEHAFAAVDAITPLRDVRGVGHRVVHGGRARMEHQRITPAVTAALREAVPLARNHMPQALAGIESVTRALPNVAQVACFDTAFHRSLPRVARMYALPASVRVGDESRPLPPLQRFGFHGLSYEYLMSALSAIDPVVARGRVIVLHLGNGASIAAIGDGNCVETSMGFTPNSGLVMGTRSGDVDPGILSYLLRETGLPLDTVEHLLERQSGLLGVSGTTADMRELLAREHDDRAAAEAIALFCHRAIKYVGAYVSVLRGVDAVVFSGGIGERSPAIRERICTAHEHLGLRIDPVKNAAHAPLISDDSSAVSVRVIPTDEESMIVGHTLDVLDIH